MSRQIAWSLMTFLAVAVGAYAGALILVPTIRPAFVLDLFGKLPTATYFHLAGGLAAIILGAFQVNSRLRARFLNAHRWMGRLYVASVMAAGVAGLIMASRSTGGLVTHFGFGMMAVCWLGTTVVAYIRIRNGDVAAHRAWMLRSYALTLAAVTLRIYLPASQIAGIDFIEAYQAISWMCWVPNLLVVEWIILGTQSGGRAQNNAEV